ncbi:MAG TPA: hypothetical protein VGK44_18225, partial [Casimicrobiaceae bacterium]
VTLLELAIAASVAVVPVLLAVLLFVVEVRPSDPSARRSSDRYISVRQVAALQTFERAIVRRDRVRAALPTADALLAGVPSCQREWDGRLGPLQRLRQMIAPSSATQLSPAQKLAAEIDAVDAALLRFSSGTKRRVTDTVGFDASRWFDALRSTLQSPVETPEYPGRKFIVQCADIAGAVAMLARGDGRMLTALAWRGTVVERTLATWRAEQYVEISAKQIARGNPWIGLPGCVYLGNATHGDAALPAYFVTAARRSDAELCASGAMSGQAGDDRETHAPLPIAGEANDAIPADDPRWSVPPSLGAMLQPLSSLTRPSGALYRLYTEAPSTVSALPTAYRFGPNRIDVRGAPVDVGFSIDVTIDPAAQALAQRTVACYTGRQDVCRTLRLQRKEDESAHAIGHRMLEHAVVRMAAVAIIDVASGRIEALAGALSPCTRQEYDGPGREARCDKRLPYPIRYRPDALLNPAVFHDAMPASIIKPIMAAAFLSDPIVGARWMAAERADLARGTIPALDTLRGQLMRSNSARFLDRMFCADRGFVDCRRPWEIQASAFAFGWNGGCTQAADDCGKRDLLFGRAVDASDESGVVTPLALRVPYGRLLVEPVGLKLGAPLHLRAPMQLDIAKVQRCAAGADGKRLTGDDWEKCRGTIVDVVAEGWGQGQARSSALGVAGMMASLASAANGQTTIEKPHLVHALRGVGPADAARLAPAVLRWSLAAPEPNRIAPEAAQIILSGLSYSHRAGTARLACEQVLDPKACREIDWIAGKTGTPTFPNDGRSLGEIAQLCKGSAGKNVGDHSACGPLRPYKWYAAAYRTDRNDAHWTKVIGVLTERNWLADTGRIHGAGDLGPNPAAEIALQIAARHTGFLAGDGK